MRARAILSAALALSWRNEVDPREQQMMGMSVYAREMNRHMSTGLVRALLEHLGDHIELGNEEGRTVMRRDFYIMTRPQFNELDKALREMEHHRRFSYEQGCREGRREALATTGEHFGWKGE